MSRKSKPARKKPGPPKTGIDLEQVETLAGMGCTLDDIGRVVKLGKRTLIRRMDDAKFQEAIERGRAKGRCSLRKAQFDAALTGNVTAQIWLGKQLLGQRSFEKAEPEKPPEKPDKVTYQWVPPASSAESNTTPSPAREGSTTPEPDSKASQDPLVPGRAVH